MNIFVEVVLTGLYMFVALVLTVMACVCVLGAIASADMRDRQRKWNKLSPEEKAFERAFQDYLDV